MFDSLELFHIHVVFPFGSIFPYTNLKIDINGVISLIVASSIQVIDDKISIDFIAILTLESVELIS